MHHLKYSQKMLNGLIATTAVLLPNAVMAATCPASQICINEAADNGQSYYEITNNSNAQIFAFAVYNQGLTSNTSTTTNAGWTEKTLSEATWNEGSALIFDDGTKWATGVNPFDGYTNLETFFNTFNKTVLPVDYGANIYWNKAATSSTNPTALLSGTTLSNFEYDGTFTGGSTFVAFNSLGAMIDISNNLTTGSLTPPDTPVSSVPEPETYLMFLAGLGLLGFASRQRKSTKR